MENQFELNAESRSTHGSSNSRRLRRAGMVPAVVYGGKKKPVSICVEFNALTHHLQNEAFYSHILVLNLDGKRQNVILRDLQRHPTFGLLHFDLFRVSADQVIKVHAPLHFVGEDACIGVKQQGGIVSHLQVEVEISCLPKHLPEFLEVDISQLELGHVLHLSDIKLPKGVEIVILAHGEENDNAIVSVNTPRIAHEETTEEAVAIEDEVIAEADSTQDASSD